MKNHTEILATILTGVICTHAKVDALCNMYLHTEHKTRNRNMEDLTKVFNESVKLYSFDKLSKMFGEIGFSVFKVFGNYKGESFSELGSERLIIIFTL